MFESRLLNPAKIEIHKTLEKVETLPARANQQQTMKKASNKIHICIVGCHDNVPAFHESLQSPDDFFLIVLGMPLLR